MRIRHLLIVACGLAAVVAAVVVAGLLYVTAQASAALDEQAEAQQVNRHVVNMLSLTHEFTVYGGERVAGQWRARQAQLLAALDGVHQRHAGPSPELDELRRNVADLPALFERLAAPGLSLPDGGSLLGQRRRDLLLERLITETQEVAESSYRWSVKIGEAQRHGQRLYTVMVLAAPAALLLLLVALALLIGQRVLRPLARLQQAAAAIQRGELSVRCASASADELGDAARAVDAMTMALQQQTAALGTSERRLRQIADNLPALMVYVDTEQRYTFANAYLGRVFGSAPESIIGRTMREVRGEAIYADLQPHVEAALSGRHATFESTAELDGQTYYYQANYIPDVDEAGQVRGFYAMTFDFTALKLAQQQQARTQAQLRAITDNLPVLIAYLDEQQRGQFYNATLKRWVGVEPAQAIGRTLAEVIPPATYALCRPFLQRALAGERVEFELESRSPTTVRILHVVYIPDLRPDGTVVGLYSLSTDVTVMKRVQQQLNELARLDVLTGLPNRRHFEERIVEAMARCARLQRPMALMFLDVDHFKSINDRLGHAAGDGVLKEFGQRLRASVRATDMAARLAGDEFVVLLEGLQAAQEAGGVAEKIMAAIRQPFDLDGQPLRVTTSVGVAFVEQPMDHDAVMACADKALYEAKAAGRDTYAVCTACAAIAELAA